MRKAIRIIYFICQYSTDCFFLQKYIMLNIIICCKVINEKGVINMNKIKVAIVGVGNCASNLIQGITYYRKNQETKVGLAYRKAGGYDVTDIEFVAAFDIADNKVGLDLSEAIFSAPNCTDIIAQVPKLGVTVQKGPVLDGWDEHLSKYVKVSKEEYDVKSVLEKTSPDILLILLPTASEKACYMYAEIALELGISVVNAIPVLLTHDSRIESLARSNCACIVGDDLKSQIGGTILHHSLMHLLEMRGIEIDSTYQINYAGNTDFLNLVSRGESKHASKARGIMAGTSSNSDISINVTFVENRKDTKTCKIYIEGRNFGNCPVKIETELTVTDSANASGVLVDLIRCVMVSKEKGQYGRLEAPSAFYMKSPYNQLPDEVAKKEINSLLEVI